MNVFFRGGTNLTVRGKHFYNESQPMMNVTQKEITIHTSSEVAILPPMNYPLQVSTLLRIIHT
mgnify:CR=1 FL=1